MHKTNVAYTTPISKQFKSQDFVDRTQVTICFNWNPQKATNQSIQIVKECSE